MDYLLQTPFWIQIQFRISLKVLQGEAVCISCVGTRFQKHVKQ
jgi:hypothetical protein